MGFTIGGGGQGDFLVPPAGMKSAVLADFVIKEGVEQSFQGQSKVVDTIQLRFLSAELITEEAFEEQDKEFNEDQVGRPYMYVDTLNLWTVKHRGNISERSNLYKRLSEWGVLSGAGDHDSVESFFESLVGTPALLNITHKPRKDRDPWAQISSVNPLANGMTPATIPPDYVRVKDREEADGSFNFGANAVAGAS